MNNRGGLNLGDEIRNIVQDAVNSMNFNRLNQDVRDFANGALDEVRQSAAIKRRSFAKSNKTVVPVGKVLGTVLTVIGSIGSSMFLIASMVTGAMGYKLGISVMRDITTLIMMPLFILSTILLVSGIIIRGRFKRFRKYVSEMNGLSYYMIKDLAAATGRSSRYIAKDLRKMIALRMFPEGHIDDKNTYFMLDNESYELYLRSQENMRMREKEEALRRKEQGTMDPEIRKAIDEGRQFVRKIRNANIEIPGEEISRKLDRLEEVTGKIYDYVESHPEKFSAIKKFTEYFLPTTLKLLDAYRHFDNQTVKGENISTAKKEIEDTLDTINLAFENLLDDLFQEAAMDVSTDISVLETMLAQEGLSQKNIK
ncbi:5-bromo-4-chloroindolyl phosphate hydrolysis family protein [Sedimentibacter sp.]|uniref:5-bromo-4-chloroindolyl phosphate hydrolysis family protein n=1 Tax=Sedimentibacter sp. TaxID=1960295 RepID=UPI0028A1F941|nr:5-bromo-4-chloroindolyl phosphate hydrolysis family protein [Sedimentibacter sp.]